MDAAVEVDGDAEVLAARVADFLHTGKNRVHLVVGVDHLQLFGGVHLHRRETSIHLLLRCAACVTGTVSADPRIDLHFVAAASSHELIYGRVEHLTLDIPESLVDARERTHQNAAATVEARAVDGAPDILNA